MNQVVLSVRIRGDEEGPQTGDVVLSPTKIPSFLPNTFYGEGDFVVYKNSFYQAKDSFISGDVFNSEDWNSIGSGILKINDFLPNTAYEVNQPCIYNSCLYRANMDFTSGDTFDPNNWSKIGGEGEVTKSYVDRRDSEVLISAKDYIDIKINKFFTGSEDIIIE